MAAFLIGQHESIIFDFITQQMRALPSYDENVTVVRVIRT